MKTGISHTPQYYLQELENVLAAEALPKKEVLPQEIRSNPFQSFRQGMSEDVPVKWIG